MSVPPTLNEPVVAIVVAAGSGTRLGADVPKALVKVGERSLVLRSVEQLAAGGCAHAFVVIPSEHEAAFRRELASASIGITLVTGGATRQDSVRHGLRALETAPLRSELDGLHLEAARIVLIHDAARAFVPAEVVTRVVDAVAAGAPAVIPVVPVVDTIRELNQVGSAVIDRSHLRAVQTPQGFDRDTIVDAHRLVEENGAVVTDDAAAVEFVGGTVALVEGAREAFKVTEPLDLLVADALAARA